MDELTRAMKGVTALVVWMPRDQERSSREVHRTSSRCKVRVILYEKYHVVGVDPVSRTSDEFPDPGKSGSGLSRSGLGQRRLWVAEKERRTIARGS